MDKVEIKEKSYLSDFCSQNDRKLFPKDFDKVIKNETVTSSSFCDKETKTKIGKKLLVSTFCSQNQGEFLSENPIIEHDKISKDKDIETKIEIKEEQWWLERSSTETFYVYNDIKDGTDGNFFSTDLQSLYKEGDSSYKITLFSGEDLGEDLNLSIVKEEPECDRARKCQNQGNDITDTSSIKTSVCSKENKVGKIDSTASCLKQNHFFQQGDIGKHSNKVNCKSNLDRDNLSCNNRKPFRCEICEKCFIWLSDLKRHKLIHEAIKPHQCVTCDKGFKHLSHLKMHQLIHDGIKPHKCNICGKAFTQFSSLKIHKLIHEGVKPHKCNICDKPFSRLSSLKTHKLIHEGKKPHKCNICCKAFTQLSSLKTHRFIHEGTKPHKCNICDKAFTRLSHLKTHKLIHESN